MKRVVLVVALLLLASCKRKKPEVFTSIMLDVDYACGQVASGAVVCWGGKYGAVPRAVPELTALPKPASPSPPADAKAVGIDDAFEVATGRAHSCVLRRDATVWCWGDNAFFQLADGTTVSRDQPRMIQGVFGVQQIVAAADGTCARLGDGDMRCWGNNTHGQLSPQMRAGGTINVPTSIRH